MQRRRKRRSPNPRRRYRKPGPKRIRAATSLSDGSHRIQRRQHRLDLSAVGLEPWRQHELLAEVLEIFVGGEARAVGRELEQHTARLEEIHRLEPESVDDLCRPAMRRRDAFAHLKLDHLVSDAPSDVMHRADAPRATRRVLDFTQLDVFARAAVAYAEAMPAVFDAEVGELQNIGK